MRGFQKGYTPWNKGLKTGPLSEDHKKKLSDLFKGREPWNTGQELDFRHKESISLGLNKYYKAHIHRVPTERARRMGLAQIGRKFSEDHKTKISESVSKAYVEGRLNKENRLYHTGHFYSAKNGSYLFYRSSWELRAFKQLEKNRNVVFYKYEPFMIKYRAGFDKVRRYIPDILIEDINGLQFLLEIKPLYEKDLELNRRKFKAAKDFCNSNNINFFVCDDVAKINKLRYSLPLQ